MSRHLPRINVHEKNVMALNVKKQLKHNYVWILKCIFNIKEIYFELGIMLSFWINYVNNLNQARIEM
jgi:hypothetical protein